MKKALLMTMLSGVAMSSPAFALDEQAILKQMQQMQEQMQQMQKQMSNLKNELSEAKQEAASAKKTAGEAKVAKAGKPPEPKGSDVKVSLSPGPKLETADGEYSFKVGGFAQVDAGFFDDERADYSDGWTVRRARLNASGTIAKVFNYKIENDFANNVSALTDVYLEYTGLKPTTLMVGQFKEPFGLETLTSDLHTNFVERASTVAFSPDRKIGAMVSTSGTVLEGGWTLAVGGFGDGTGVNSNDDEAKDATARFTFAPIAEKTRVLHFGIAGSHRVPDSASDAMTFSSRPETQLSNSRNAVSTGSITAIDNVNLTGLEAAAVWGPASIQGEYVRAAVDRRAGFMDPTFDGYYVEASYFLTGESRNYVVNQGKFDRVRPMWSFNPSQGQWGAWQVMTRFSDLDLTDANIRGGEMRNTTFGVKWYPHANVAIVADYIRSNVSALTTAGTPATTSNDHPQAWVLRTQFDF